MTNATSLLVSGTDTGVGKTVVTALLALHFRERGFDVGVMKPFATGCERVDGHLESADARWLREIVGVEDELELINPARWEEPLAPLVAARRAGNAGEDWIERCRQAYKSLCARHEIIIVEGIGGLAVPLQEQWESDCQSTFGQSILAPNCADLAGALELPIVLVARRNLGTINHTLLSTRLPLPAPSRFIGLVFCDAEPMEEDVAAQTNVEIVAELCALPIWGVVPHLTDWSAPALKEIARTLRPTMESGQST